ncbi:unnamed protein product [Ranitomeya imitator]|uniref:Uncharacterized protein n=1 Tax=Ranitomeya imitator TaxID=111125 RepID=A0ABN9LXG0_9NEOB|nr:unnamed protein product [Ranitomeya imitator]
MPALQTITDTRSIGRDPSLDPETMDLDKLETWAERWQMRFNNDKCKVIHMGRGNQYHHYTLNGKPLGLCIAKDRKNSRQNCRHYSTTRSAGEEEGCANMGGDYQSGTKSDDRPSDYSYEMTPCPAAFICNGGNKEKEPCPQKMEEQHACVAADPGAEMATSGLSSKEALNSRLQQLECHFTWGFLKKDEDLDELENRLNDQLTFLVTKNTHMVYNFLAYVIHLKEDYTKAITTLEKAEEMINENNPDGADQNYLVTYGNYAWVYYYMKQYEDSQKYVDKVEQIYKELQDRQDIAEIYGEKAWSLLKLGGKYYEKTEQCFQKALELEPEDPEWITGYATVVYRLEAFNGRRCAASEYESLELLKKAVEKNPNDPVVKALLALKLQDPIRTDEGKGYIAGALEQAPKSPYLLRYVGKFYRRAGMVDEALKLKSESEAIEYYKKCLQITVPKKQRKWSEDALIRISSEKIENDMEDPEGYALLGFVHKTKGKIKDAIDCYEKALRYDPYKEEYVSELLELRKI